MKKRFLTIGLIAIVLLATLLAAASCQNTPAKVVVGSSGNLIPAANTTSTVGSASLPWSYGYFTGLASGVTGLMYGNGISTTATAATNTQIGTALAVTGIHYSAGTTVTAATNAQMGSAIGVTGVLYSAAGSTITAATALNMGQAMSTASLTAGSLNVTVTHGMGSTPAIVLLQPTGIIGTATSNVAPNPPYVTSVNATSFTISVIVAANVTTSIYWRAWLTGY